MLRDAFIWRKLPPNDALVIAGVMNEVPSDRLMDIFCSALEIQSEDKRRIYLDSACSDNAGLRSKVDDLLASQPNAERFFLRLALELAVQGRPT
jgi:hypothetical protein